MALRFNPPPNWPAPPEGFTPPAGWQPDPEWGPAPDGWQLWVEEPTAVMGTGSAPQAPSAPDAGWAPTQAVPTQPSAPSVGSAAVAGAYAATSHPQSQAPYQAQPAAYPQSPTPYQAQTSTYPPQGQWQPVSGAPAAAASVPVTRKWWFWALIAGVAVILVIALVVALTSNNSGSPTGVATRTSEPEVPTTQEPTQTPSGSSLGTKTAGPTTAAPTPTPTPTGTTKHTTELAVGDCVVTDTSATVVSTVEVVDCAEPHNYEVFLLHTLTDASLPDSATMDQYAQDACLPAFNEYVGIEYAYSSYGITTLSPKETSWALGDRTLKCLIASMDDTELVGSARGTAK